jgi:NAD(P)-dependent dehydrogenase (short-subunit alcohol dehydrogenase family)
VSAPAEQELEGMVMLVTGAGQGIGRAIAVRAATQGATVAVAEIDENNGRETCDRIARAGGTAYFARCDVTDSEAVRALVQEVVARHGRLDAAVNNAGCEGAIAPTHEYPIDAFDRVIDLNVRAVFLCLQEELRIMLGQGHGAIVNVGSIAGFAGFANFSAYNASKHAVVGLTRTAALEAATQGVRVNAVAPGFVVTPMVTDRGLKAQPGSDDFRAIADLHPMKRLGRPEEIAAAVTWLASEAASFVTGHTLAADGGYLAQ